MVGISNMLVGNMKVKLGVICHGFGDGHKEWLPDKFIEQIHLSFIWQ